MTLDYRNSEDYSSGNNSYDGSQSTSSIGVVIGSYAQTVLNSKPAGFWMITAASGTSETDLSGNAKTATITEATDFIDRGYRPLVTGTSTDRAYRFYNTNHKLTYPPLEAWEADRDHVPFSIELTYQSIDTRTEFVLFAPQETSSAYVPDNGLYVRDNALVFTVSNGSASAPATEKAQITKYLNPGQTYHVVAVYDRSKIYLYVDGKLAGQSAVSPTQKFTHTTANFVTTSLMQPGGSVNSEAIVDAVSFYRRALKRHRAKRHYVMSTPNVSDIDLVNSLGGKLIKINDEDRTKALDYSARERGWSNPLNKLTDVIVDDEGNLSLKKIKPAKLIRNGVVIADTGLYNADKINLENSTVIRVDSLAGHIGASSGSIGGFFDATAIRNDNTSEQIAASVASSNQDYIFEIVKKSDKNIYLRYQYKDQSGVTQTTETSWGALLGLLETNVYFFLEWGGGLVSLYINSTASPAQIAFESGVPVPQFDAASFAIIGGGADKTRTWNNFFNWIKLYNRPQSLADFTANKTSTNGYTVKLANSLNVSQSGSAEIVVPTGVDTAVPVSQTRVSWEPRSTKTLVSTSLDGITYQTASAGSEVVAGEFPANLPAQYFSRIILSTDDSYYSPTMLSDLKLEAHADSTIFSENSWDQLLPEVGSRIYPAITPAVSQTVNNGWRAIDANTWVYVEPVDDSSNTTTPTGGSGVSLAGPAANIRTLEFWVYPETQGYYSFSTGTEYSTRYYNSGGFTTTGWTTLYVDGASTANAVTSTTWYNRWHHIILTNASTQINLHTASMYLGRPAAGQTQSTARYQNIAYYPQTFTAVQALENYRAYLGDVSAGTGTDAPGSRTLTDNIPKFYSDNWETQVISVR